MLLDILTADLLRQLRSLQVSLLGAAQRLQRRRADPQLGLAQSALERAPAAKARLQAASVPAASYQRSSRMRPRQLR